MSAAERVALVDLHIATGPGVMKVVHAGEVIPEELHDEVTNTDAYVVTDEEQELADEAQQAADAAEAAKLAAAAQAKAKADADAADEAAKRAAAEKVTPPIGDQVPASQEPAADDYDVTTEPEHGTLIAERSYKSLQVAAKARGLKADGNQDALVARLEADDRERAENN